MLSYYLYYYHIFRAPLLGRLQQHDTACLKKSFVCFIDTLSIIGDVIKESCSALRILIIKWKFNLIAPLILSQIRSNQNVMGRSLADRGVVWALFVWATATRYFNKQALPFKHSSVLPSVPVKKLTKVKLNNETFAMNN